MKIVDSYISYLKFEKRFSSHTVVSYSTDIRQFFDYCTTTYDMMAIEEVQSIHVRSWIVHLLQEKVNSRTVNRKISSLRSYFNHLRRRGHLENNPMSKITAPRVGKRLPVYIQEGQIRNLFEKVEFPKGFVGVRDKMILLVLYTTGIRRAELINLKINDFDFSLNQFKVFGKGKKERIIPFSVDFGGEIKAYIECMKKEFLDKSEPYLFLTSKGLKLYPKLVYNLVNKYLNIVSSVEYKGPHVLRHSFATHLSNNGAELNAIKELLGHSSLAATQIYTHNSIEKLKKAYQSAHPKSGNKN